MKIKNIYDDSEVHFPKLKADFLLAGSVTKTCNIEGITQAGIPGLITLTPTLDAELISTQKIYSLPQMATTPKGVPTPALITRAVHNLAAFSKIDILNLGLETLPKECSVIDFNILASEDISKKADIDAKAIFEKGLEFGKSYESQNSTIILAESTPSGTTTATATAIALSFEVEGAFSSSFKNVPSSIKTKTIDKALSHLNSDMSSFEKLSIVSDNMLIFCAGFILEASKSYKIFLAGGTQMAACLLVADTLRAELNLDTNFENITLSTTKWVVKDENSNILKLLNQLSFKVDAIYADFSFESANIPILKAYDQGEAKEGVGAGGSIVYAYINGISNEEIVREVENVMGSLLS